MSAESAGEGPDLGTLFETHFDYLWNSLRRLGVRDPDLEDLVHDVFLKVHQHRREYDTSRPFRPWLFGFAYRVAADYRRLARHRVEVLGSHAEPADPGEAPDSRVEAAQAERVLRTALDSLDLPKRAVFVLHDIEGQAAPQIAETLSIPLNTVYSRLRAGRSELQASLRRLRAREEA
ncbi:MAG: RNA polymerase sigma factor [Polyangiaceae bacterium]